MSKRPASPEDELPAEERRPLGIPVAVAQFATEDPPLLSALGRDLRSLVNHLLAPYPALPCIATRRPRGDSSVTLSLRQSPATSERRSPAATPEDVGHAHGAGITCMAPRGPPPMDRAWRPQALVVALFGWRSDQRVKAARGPWAVSSAPRMSLGRSATLGRASSRVDGELLVGTACAIGLCRPRTSAYTRSLSGTISLWRRGSCQTSPCASRCRLLLMTTGS